MSLKISQVLPSSPQDYNLDTVKELMVNVLSLALDFVGVIAVIYIIIGGYFYITAYGNEAQIKKGKDTLTWAIVGLVIILLAKVIITEVWQFFTGLKIDFWGF